MRFRFLGYKFQKLRKKKGITQDQAAVAAGVSGGYISELESGKKVNPNPEIVEKLGNLLGVHPTYFYLNEAVTIDQIAEEIPQLEPEILEFLQKEGAMEWLVLAESAKRQGIPPKVLRNLISVLKDLS